MLKMNPATKAVEAAAVVVYREKAQLSMTLKSQNNEPHCTFICPNDLMMRYFWRNNAHQKSTPFRLKSDGCPNKTWCDTEMHKLLRILAKGQERTTEFSSKNPRKKATNKTQRICAYVFMLWHTCLSIYYCELDLRLLQMWNQFPNFEICACVFVFRLNSHLPPRPPDQNELITHLFHTEWFSFFLRFLFVWAYL